MARLGQQQTRQQQQTPVQAPTADREMDRLAEEYNAEAERLAEQLELCGIKKEALSSKARLSLHLLASTASKLQLAEARPELVLAAWADLLVKESRATAVLHKLQEGIDSLAQKKAAAQATNQVLQQILQDVQSQQRRLADKVSEQAKTTGQMRVKQQEYCRTQAKYQRRLAANGFTPEITHAALEADHNRVTELQQRLAGLQAKLASYHHLPASMLGAELALQQASERLVEKQANLQSRLADIE